jgi:hypothetical protein
MCDHSPEVPSVCCAEQAISTGEAHQLGGLALWEWRDRYWRYDHVLDGLVQVQQPLALAECRRFSEVLR